MCRVGLLASNTDTVPARAGRTEDRSVVSTQDKGVALSIGQIEADCGRLVNVVAIKFGTLFQR